MEGICDPVAHALLLPLLPICPLTTNIPGYEMKRHESIWASAASFLQGVYVLQGPVNHRGIPKAEQAGLII